MANSENCRKAFTMYLYFRRKERKTAAKKTGIERQKAGNKYRKQRKKRTREKAKGERRQGRKGGMSKD